MILYAPKAAESDGVRSAHTAKCHKPQRFTDALCTILHQVHAVACGVANALNHTHLERKSGACAEPPPCKLCLRCTDCYSSDALIK
jgi:hypothetical protein